MGVVQGLLLADGGNTVCTPDGQGLFHAVDLVREWVKVHPKKRKISVRRAVMRALGERYPCRV